ncbi:F-box/kelch-repeat protein-like [Iris pallida]|uniref:F-box/kelch-repeat protein-like n=1 Tax=Iris pallida TaxID=29817 RepID=A0AAX6HH03_IRIPA|nr:F-box/kelch-repeat protein-like [Iris pallida]
MGSFLGQVPPSPSILSPGALFSLAEVVKEKLKEVIPELIEFWLYLDLEDHTHFIVGIGDRGVMHKKISLDVKVSHLCYFPDDKFLVMVSQIGCMGTILHARNSLKNEGACSE